MRRRSGGPCPSLQPARKLLPRGLGLGDALPCWNLWLDDWFNDQRVLWCVPLLQRWGYSRRHWHVLSILDDGPDADLIAVLDADPLADSVSVSSNDGVWSTNHCSHPLVVLQRPSSRPCSSLLQPPSQ